MLQVLSRYNNIGDLTGKSVAQGTATTLVGIIVGVLFSKIVTISTFESVLPFFIVLSIINSYAAYKSVNMIELNNFNRQRATLVFRHFLKTDTILTTKEISFKERITLPNSMNKNYLDFIKIGENSVEELFGKKEEANLEKILNLFKQFAEHNFICYVKFDKKKKWSLFKENRKYTIHLNLANEVQGIDIISAYLFALKVDEVLQKDFRTYTEDNKKDIVNSAMEAALSWFKSLDRDKFTQKIWKAGWCLTYLYIDKGGNRYSVMKTSEENKTTTDP